MKTLLGIITGVGFLLVAALPVWAYTPPVISGGSCTSVPPTGTVYYTTTDTVTVDYNGTGIEQITAPTTPMETVAGHWYLGHWVAQKTRQSTMSGYIATFTPASWARGTVTYWIYVQYQSQIDPVTVILAPCPA
jgi:hypothetical protein